MAEAAPRYPTELPISSRVDDIVAAIRGHQVVIVAGDTGSGKSTQLPKICLDAGRARAGIIGHTQPRRLAARTIAERVAEEMGTTVGERVGYSVRFTDRVGKDTVVRLMTDGILLAEIQRDRELRRYDTIIIDEAHERSLNVDFLLGYLKRLLPRRPDLKVVITSATIDTERFSAHFGGAPVIEVSGRTYPVEVRYRPLDEAGDEAGDNDGGVDDEPRDQITAICDAVNELRAEGPGDVLVFLSGEREIRDASEALRRLHLADTEIVPLYARLSAAEQHRVFEPHRGRRVVLATNVAETSLTVPGIRYVVDPGTARISRFNRRTKVQRLPIEPVSQASANQRAGRCGRVAPGICIRLYSEADFAARPAFTEPEILRTNLASVILQMAALDLGDVAAFPFVDPPDARSIKDGVALLEELGAIEAANERIRLTKLGRQLAQLPLDPRLGRMVLAAADNGCVREVTVIAAALSIQDPRERPQDKRQAADELHARFAHEGSDLLSYLSLWAYLEARQAELSSSRFRKLCKSEMLHYLRVREWQDVHGQIRQIARSLGARPNDEPAAPEAIHRSLLAGLLSHIGMYDAGRGDYHGARGARFAIAPGSVLFKKTPRWVMAAELVETNRLWARGVARIQPEWAEGMAPHLVRRSYGEPEWDANRATAVVDERVTLYGLPIVSARRVGLRRIDPAGAREMFIQHALVEGDWQTHHAFLHHNRALRDELEQAEARARRHGVLVDDAEIFALYDERVGPTVASGADFDKWWRSAKRSDPDLLTFTVDDLVRPDAPRVDPRAFPDVWHHDDLALAIRYEHDRASDTDGVTVEIPLGVINRVHDVGFDWNVPGFREELVLTLIKTLPKHLRRSLIPAREHALAFLERRGPDDGPLLDVLTDDLSALTGERIPWSAWRPESLPPHLRVTFEVVDDNGAPVARGTDLEALRAELRHEVQATISSAAGGIERTALRSWPADLPELPRVVDVGPAAARVRGYPALVDETETVGVRVFAAEHEQASAMRQGTRRLVLLTTPSPLKALQRLLPTPTKLALAHPPHASVGDLFRDCVAAAVDALVDQDGGPAWSAERFEVLRAAVADELVDMCLDVCDAAAQVLTAAADVRARADRTTAAALQPAVDDVRAQVERLVAPGFVATTGAARLRDVVRYLRAADRRLERVSEDVARDAELMRRVRGMEVLVDDEAKAAGPAFAAHVERVRWMVEELRVSFFAQSLGTAGRVSEQRIVRELRSIAHDPGGE